MKRFNEVFGFVHGTVRASLEAEKPFPGAVSAWRNFFDSIDKHTGLRIYGAAHKNPRIGNTHIKRRVNLSMIFIPPPKTDDASLGGPDPQFSLRAQWLHQRFLLRRKHAMTADKIFE